MVKCPSFSYFDDAFKYVPTSSWDSKLPFLHPLSPEDPGHLPKYKPAHLTPLLSVLQGLSTTLIVKPHIYQLASYDLAPACAQTSAPSTLFFTETYLPSCYFPNTLCSFYLGSFVLAVPCSCRDLDYHCPSVLGLNATSSERPSLSSHPVIHCIY